MIEEGHLKIGDKVFLYRGNAENSVGGIIKNISYPILKIFILKDDKDSIIEVDISKNIPLTLLTEDQIKNCLTKYQKKIFNKEEEEIVDIFSGMH